MKALKRLFAILTIGLLGFTSAYAYTSFSFSIGTDNFYLPVGDYDYLPYARSYATPRISFHSVMSDYGTWVSVQPFGQVWKPYAYSGWRPYVYGHWIYTSYGPTWQGYEPWAWAGYHYGNWIWTQQFGWVWIPGYDWHPGRVQWSHSYDTVGWMPAPPYGYDYSRGYLNYRGSVNQFNYNDSDFGYDYDPYYGGPYHNSQYRDLYYNPSYTNLSVNLWVFIDRGHFNYDNYAPYYLDRDYTYNVFNRKLVRISSRAPQRAQLERVVKQRITEVPVQVREIETDKRKVKMIVPVGEEEKVRKNAHAVVKNVIAPAFVEKRKPFKGLQSKNKDAVAKIFHQENREPKLQKVSGDQVIKEAQDAKKNHEVQRQKITRKEIEEVVKVEKEAKVKHQNKEKSLQQQPEKREETPNRDERQFELKKKSEEQSSSMQNRQSEQAARPDLKNTDKDRDAEFELSKKQSADQMRMWQEQDLKQKKETEARIQAQRDAELKQKKVIADQTRMQQEQDLQQKKEMADRVQAQREVELKQKKVIADQTRMRQEQDLQRKKEMEDRVKAQQESSENELLKQRQVQNPEVDSRRNKEQPVEKDNAHSETRKDREQAQTQVDEKDKDKNKRKPSEGEEKPPRRKH